MTNSLIPYTFVPGSKAKAGEVNANFIALAEEIQSTQTSCNNKFTEINQTISDDMDEVYAKCADKDLINTNTYTNTIITAPNGILEYSGSIVTVKSGLKVLIADGKNANGSCKSINYTVEEDITLDLSGYSDGKRSVYLTSTGVILAPLTKSCYYQSATPTQFLTANCVWYNPDTNTTKKYNTDTTSWEEVNAVHLGYITLSSNAISDIEVNPNVEFIKRTDIDHVAKLAYLSKNVTSLSVGAANSTYKMAANGYLFYQVTTTANSATVEVVNNTRNYSHLEHKNANFFMSGNIPVCKGDVIRVDYRNVSWNFLKFVYAQCEEV